MKEKAFRNAAWIIGTKLIQSALALGISMMTARYLGPENYGLVQYAAAVIAFFMPFMQLGLNSTLVSELIAAPLEEGKTLGTSLALTFFSALLCSAGILLFSAFTDNGNTGTIWICTLYSLKLFAESVHLIQYWFQAKLLSKYTSTAMLIAYFCASAYKISLLVSGASIYWFSVTAALDVAVIDICLLGMYRRCKGQKLSFSWKHAKHMLSRSKSYILANLMVVVFAQSDKMMIKLMISEMATGVYSAAVTCAGMTSFLFAALMDTMRPVLLEKKKRSEKTYILQLKSLFTWTIYVSLLQCVVITVFAPVLVGFLYGDTFGAAAEPLRIIIWYTTLSYLGAVRNLWILAEKKHNILWKINLSGAILNISLNFVMIPKWGISGAAAASLITQCFTNVILCILLKSLRPVAELMLHALWNDSKSVLGLDTAIGTQQKIQKTERFFHDASQENGSGS